jgi:tagatose 6-phosphate kinase
VILVVVLNPALDVTHHVEGADWAGVNRPHQVMTRPGGKGVNVARVLLALGTDVLVTGLAGGAAGDAVQAGLEAAGVPADLTPIAGETRRTFAVVDTARGQTGLFNEPGPQVSAAEFARFRDRYRAALPSASAIVLSGSLPRGLPANCYAELTRLAAGVPVVLDTDGPALRSGAAARPAIIKPNLAELERSAGRSLRVSAACSASPPGSTASADSVTTPGSVTPSGPARGAPAGTAAAGSGTAPARGGAELAAAPASQERPADLAAVTEAARGLMAAGAAAVVVSLGADGLLAVTGTGTWLAAPPGPEPGNPTGAGDAATAGLARGLALGQDWPDRLRHAVALGTAAVAAPVAGEFGRERYRELLPAIRLTRRPDTRPDQHRPDHGRHPHAQQADEEPDDVEPDEGLPASGPDRDGPDGR